MKPSDLPIGSHIMVTIDGEEVETVNPAMGQTMADGATHPATRGDDTRHHLTVLDVAGQCWTLLDEAGQCRTPMWR